MRGVVLEADAPARLIVRSLSKNFGGVHALTSVDLEVGKGETVGLIGPNGSGKTTLVNCVSGVLAASSGRIGLEGRDVTRVSRARRARAGIGRTYQSLRLFRELTVAENVEAGLVRLGHHRSAARRTRVAEELEAHNLVEMLHVRVADLPYGVQKRVEIARTLVSEPRVLLLDEPAAGLGAEETAELRDVLVRTRERLRLSVVIIDHDVSLIMAVSDRITVLHEGRVLFSGLPTETANDPAVISAYLGTQAIETKDA